MKRRKMQFIGYFLFIGLISFLILGMTACGSQKNTPTLSSIVITPNVMTTLAMGGSRQFDAIATYTGGLITNITYEVTWMSSDTTIATISGLGMIKGLATGNTKITATMSGIISPALTLTVKLLSSIALTPVSPAILAVGVTQQFIPTGIFADGSTEDISSQVTWASDTTGTATIASTGLATALAAGNTNITASVSGITSPTVSLTVEALSSIDVEPSHPTSLAVGSTQQFTAAGTFTDGSTEDITSQVTWGSDSTGIVTIGYSTGLATGVAAGTANIMATLHGTNSQEVTLTVVAP